MEVGIAILALSFGLAAVAIAIAVYYRTRRATRELARELVQLRNRLLRAEHESGVDSEGDGRASGSAQLVEAMSARIETLEHRLRDALERRVAIGAGEPSEAGRPELGQQVVAGLHRRGYRDIVVLEVSEDGGVLVETERDGIVAKGFARVTEDGAVELESVSSVRAFP